MSDACEGECKAKKVPLGAVNDQPGSSRNYKTGSWRAMKPVPRMEDCIKCYFCYIYCPDAAIAKSENGPVWDYDYCKGCGVCAHERPKKCIDMVEEEK